VVKGSMFCKSDGVLSVVQIKARVYVGLSSCCIRFICCVVPSLWRLYLYGEACKCVFRVCSWPGL
jgi:hypothetical protein